MVGLNAHVLSFQAFCTATAPLMGTEWIRDISTRAGPTLSARARDQRPLLRKSVRLRLHKAPQTAGQAARLRHRAPQQGARSAGRHGGGGEAAGGGDVGQGGEPPPGRVRVRGGGVGAAPGPERADQDGALCPEEGRAQGRRGPLGADRGGGRGRRVPRRAAPQAALLRRPLRRRRGRPGLRQGGRVGVLPPRQGVCVRGVRERRRGAAGMLRGADGRGAPAVEQALQHLHPLLRAGRLRHGLRPRGRRRHGPPLRLLRARSLPALLAGWAQAGAAEIGIKSDRPHDE